MVESGEVVCPSCGSRYASTSRMGCPRCLVGAGLEALEAEEDLAVDGQALAAIVPLGSDET